MPKLGKRIADAMWARQMVRSRLDEAGCVRSTCSVCGLITDFDPHLARVPGSAFRRKNDLMCLNDLRPLFSLRFVEFIERHATEVPKFVQFGTSPYYLVANCRVVPFDVDSRKYQLDRTHQCSVCGQYETQVGGIPMRLREGKFEGLQFARTDLEFGSGNNRAPVYIVGCELGELIRTAGMSGIIFTEVIGPEE